MKIVDATGATLPPPEGERGPDGIREITFTFRASVIVPASEGACWYLYTRLTSWGDGCLCGRCFAMRRAGGRKMN